MFCRPGSGLPMDSKVLRPMTTGLPSVMPLNRLRSSGRCHGSALSRPITPLSAAATTRVISIRPTPSGNLVERPTAEPAGKTQPLAHRGQHLVLEALGQERDETPALGQQVGELALARVDAQLAPVLRAPCVVEVEHGGDGAHVGTLRPVEVARVRGAGGIAREVA